MGRPQKPLKIGFTHSAYAMTPKSTHTFPIWGLLLVVLSLAGYLLDEWAFNHRYFVQLDYQGRGVHAAEVQFYTDDEVVHTERLVNRKGDAPSVRQRLQFRTREDVVGFSAVLLDQTGQVVQPALFNEVLVKTKWGQVQQLSVASNPLRLEVGTTHATLQGLLKRNGSKLLLALLAASVVLVVLSRLQSLRPHRWALLFLFSLVMMLTLMSGEVISDRTIYGDGVGQLRAAYNLYAHNVFAEQLGNPPVPDNFIEPFPAFVNSLYFRLLEWRLQAPLEFAQMHWGNLVYLVKQIHLMWIFVGQMSLALFVYALSRKAWLAAVSVLLAQVFFFGNYRVVDTYYTELQGGVLLLLSSMALYFTVLRFGIWPSVASGFLLALLALTKASFYYINLVVLLVLALVLLYVAWAEKRFTIKKAIAVWFAVLVAYAAVLGPWVARNYALFNSPAISDRGGIVLYIRATKNQMNAEEVRGALYLYGPRLYHRLGEWWPYARPLADELDPNTGAWMRVNRNSSPNSFFAQVRNELSTEMAVIGEGGKTKTLNEVAKDMNQRALDSIKADPIKHLGISMVFLWRGMWDVVPANFPFLSETSDAIFSESILFSIYLFAVLGMLFAILNRNMRLFSLGCLGFGGVMFYALLSHFLPRYMLVFYPVLILFTMVFLFDLLSKMQIKKSMKV